MDHRLQLRIAGLPAEDWRDEFQDAVRNSTIRESVQFLSTPVGVGQSAVVDPTIVAAVILGGSAILAATIPLLVGVIKRKSLQPRNVVNIAIHGTRNTIRFQWQPEGVSTEQFIELTQQTGEIMQIEVIPSEPLE